MPAFAAAPLNGCLGVQTTARPWRGSALSSPQGCIAVANRVSRSPPYPVGGTQQG